LLIGSVSLSRIDPGSESEIPEMQRETARGSEIATLIVDHCTKAKEDHVHHQCEDRGRNECTTWSIGRRSFPSSCGCL